MLGSVTLLSGAVTYAGASFTLNRIAEAAVSAPIRSNLKPSYVAVLPAADAGTLDVARSVPVVVRGKPADGLHARQAAQAFTHTVAVEALRVRNGPHNTMPQVFVLKGGSPVTVTREVRGWALIDGGHASTGWVYAKLLQPAQTSVASQG
ncbi:hypothetical protein VW23_006535 [Devosia insulae DS-56]|uniref:SH3b domain-containing protein n=1 Tax=Devosia insulae DS-56 TaxID=1116389 RepID=A0A1E5XHH4_9HYPH|nr:SH3 domain-containing protein [Devosia insulae]OEO28048.1 hypothetical protein VW23_006535 [Devosia insulae DS-56]